ncbi:MAG: DUF4340 domain-containing protein [Porcipelethomonas sp.]
MKRIKIAIIVMAAVLVAALGVYFAATAYNNKKTREAEEEANKLVMFSFDSEEADCVEIHNESGDFRIVEDSTWGWVAENSENLTVDSSVISAIVINMADLTADKILENNSDPSKYGFDDPIKITVTASDEKYTLLVGNASGTYENFYMMKENDSNIYLVPYEKGAVFCLDKDSMKSKYFSDFLASEVEEFCLWEGSQKDENILFHIVANDDGTWRMVAPYEDDSVYNTDVSTFINDAIRDKVSGFTEEDLQEKDYGKYGFDDPSNVFEMSGSGKHIKVIFGNDTEDGKGKYVLFEDSGQVAVAENGTISVLGYTTSDMINTVIYSESISYVTELEITMPGHTASITMNASDRQFTCNEKEIDGDDEEAVKAFTDFYDSFNNAYLSVQSAEAEPDGEAAVSINYVLNSNVTALVEYIPVSDDPDDGYYAMKNNQYTGYIVDSDVIDGIISAYESLEGYLK